MVYGTEEFDDTLAQIIKTSEVDYVGRHTKLEGYRHSCYQQCCDHAEEMSWHIYGVTPAKLLERVRPREDPEVTKYRQDNYEPTTKSAADKAINIVSKIFNPNLYSIRWKGEGDSVQKLKEYTMEYYPEYNSVVNYTKDVLLRKMLADPNGVVAIKLVEIPDATYTEPEPPVIVTYGSPNVWNYDYDHFLIFIRKEEDKDDQQRKICWYYFDYYDYGFYREFRAYVKHDHSLVIEDLKIFAHNFGEIPAWRLQGKSESMDNGEIMYKSYFDSAVPYWNLSIIHESDVLGAFINHIHPLRVEVAEECNFVWKNRFRCTKGKITEDNGEVMSCPRCEGSGYKNQGPYSVFRVSKSKIDEGEGVSPTEAVSYVNVPTDATKMLEERSDRMRRQGMWAINMDVEDEVGEVQSGAAKVIDRSAQYDTLYNIGSVVFGVHLTNIFYFINGYMNQVKDRSVGKEPDKNLPEINKPTQFDIASTSELVANYKVAKDSGLDPNFLQLKQQEIATRDLETNPDLKKMTFLLLDLDPLPGMSASDVSMNVSRFFVRQVDAVIHFNLKSLLEKALLEHKEFMNLDKAQQKEILEEYADEIVKANKPAIDMTLLENYAKQNKKKEAPFA